jgi:hypothetical protein
MQTADRDFIYGWSRVGGAPSVLTPPIEKRIQILHLVEDLGIDMVNLGLPGAGPRVNEDVLRSDE